MAYTLPCLYTLLLTIMTTLRDIYHDPAFPEEEMKCQELEFVVGGFNYLLEKPKC